MNSTKIMTVVGARPQFIKAAAVSRAIAAHNQSGTEKPVLERIVHTGQHYDSDMSEVFFDQLHIPQPFQNLQVGSGSHGKQTGEMLERIEQLLLDWTPDWLLIYGDTNSTLAGALAASKLKIPVAHVEAGLRSFNRGMPEEVNRVLTDHVSDLLFCPTTSAVSHLRYEGITNGVHLTGDVMFDSVLYNSTLAEQESSVLHDLALKSKDYYLATIHRAENTDDPERMKGIIEAIRQLQYRVVIPMHPRTRNSLGDAIRELGDSVHVVSPLSYLDMLMLEKHSRIILTDSGGVQKEAYWMNVPCVTLRDETEWTELVDAGANIIAGANMSAILSAVENSEQNVGNSGGRDSTALYGDGKSAEAMVEILLASSSLGI